MYRSPAARSKGTESVAAAATVGSPGFSPSHFSSTFPPSETPAREERPSEPRRQRPGHEVEVGRLAGVVEARPLVRDAAVEVERIPGAEPEVEDGRAQAGARRERENPLRVDGVRAALETVQHEEKRSVFGGGGVEVIQEERVAVRSGQRLAAHRHQPLRAREASPHRLRMAAAQPAGGREARMDLPVHFFGFGPLERRARPTGRATRLRAFYCPAGWRGPKSTSTGGAFGR